jgi:hypothetical protein
MKTKLSIPKDYKALFVMPDGREIEIRISDENGLGEHLVITGDDGIIVSPAATNQVRIMLA